MLEREEYVEQAYFFRVLSERLPNNVALQDLLAQVRDEVLSTTKLPMALDFLLGELNHTGVMGPAMARLAHYFTPFQTYLITEAENERGRFDMRVAIEVLRFEAGYRAADATPQGVFLYQFETLCRNRLRYDPGLQAIAADPIFDQPWRDWVLSVRRTIGLVDVADLIYVGSRHYLTQQAKRNPGEDPHAGPILFGEKEGKIALANRRKDPLYLFAALQRQLGYPVVPRPKPHDDSIQLIPQLLRRMERLETRIKLMEEEQKEGIDLARFYNNPGAIPPVELSDPETDSGAES